MGTGSALRNAEAGMQAGLLAVEVGAVPLPPPGLPGWAGVCAAEYAVALVRLRAAVFAASATLAGAAALLAVDP